MDSINRAIALGPPQARFARPARERTTDEVTRQLHQQEALLVKLLGQLQHVGVLLEGGATRLHEAAGKLKKDLASKVREGGRF